MSIWEERLGEYGGSGNGVLSGNLGCGRVMGGWDDTEEGYRVGEVEGVFVMRMKADERNNKDLQCDLGSSFEPSNVSQHQKLDETGVCTMKLFIALSISKKKCVAAL